MSSSAGPQGFTPPSNDTTSKIYEGKPFPIGRPFRVRRDWNPAGANNLTPEQLDMALKVTKGEEGYVHQVMGAGLLAVVLPRRQGFGVVPYAHLAFGTRMYGDITWDIGLPSFRVPLTANQFMGNTVLEKTIHGLLEAFRTSAAAQEFMGLWARSMLETPTKTRNVATRIINGIKSAGMFQVMRNGRVDIPTLRNQGNDSPGNIGCAYMIVYEHPPAAITNSIYQIYVGMTVSFTGRNQGHRDATRDSDTAHYRTARYATARKMFPVCRIDGSEVQNRQLRLLTEQCLVLMFQSYNPFLTAPLRQVTLPLLHQDLGMHTLTQRASCIYMGLATEVFSKTGWQSGAWDINPNFASSIKRGLNWESPIGDDNLIQERQIITRSVVPGVMEVFRTRARKVALQSTGSGARKRTFPVYFHLKLMNLQHSIEITGTNADAGPLEGETVYVIFEVVDVNNPHSHPIHWANLPTVGAPASWLLARKLGVRIEWQDQASGIWKRRYIVADTKRSTLKRDYPTASQALGFIRHLRQETIINPLPTTRNHNIANIWNFEFDHLAQTFTFEKKPIQQIQVDATIQDSPRDISAVRADLRAAGFREFNPANIDQAVEKLGHKKRTTCDRCWLAQNPPANRGYNVSMMACTKIDNGTICQPCKDNGLSCTFSPQSQLIANANLKDALFGKIATDQMLAERTIQNSSAIDFTGSTN